LEDLNGISHARRSKRSADIYIYIKTCVLFILCLQFICFWKTLAGLRCEKSHSDAAKDELEAHEDKKLDFHQLVPAQSCPVYRFPFCSGWQFLRVS
jgi:hypothetical protein